MAGRSCLLSPVYINVTMGVTDSALFKRLFGVTSDYFPDWRVGVSQASSWSWGASLGTAIGVMYTWGWWPFVIWSLGAILALPLFGILYDHIPEMRQMLDIRWIVLPMLLIQIFAFWLNQQVIFAAASGTDDIANYPLLAEPVAMGGTMVLALGIAFFIHRYGFPASVSTDVMQYTAQFGGCLIIIAAALSLGLDPGGLPAATFDGYTWAVWAMFGLLAGPPMDAQQHQRAEQAGSAFRAGLWGGVWYGIYAAAVAGVGLALGTYSPFIAILFLLTVVAVTTSTIDSAAAALQRIFPKQWMALAVAVGAVITWPLVSVLGIVGIWSIYAGGRLFVFIGILLLIGIYRKTDREFGEITFSGSGDFSPGD